MKIERSSAESSDSRQRDVARGIARIDQRTMQKLGVSSGNVIEILGKKKRELEPKNKWGIFLRAPTIYFKILNNKKVTKLGKIASIRRGITS